uniref:Serine carboxypeptidase S28 family protein n=1 Tax=Setaria digitata TaxID=48799 RepID=A0A915PD01_9BILA
MSITSRKNSVLALLALLYYCCIEISDTVTEKSSLHYQSIARFSHLENDFLDNLIERKHPVVGDEKRKRNETIAGPSQKFAQVKTAWLPQRINHFNPTDKREFKQRYMYNREFYKNSGLAFLLVGGESEISEWKIGYPSLPILLWAKKYGAACFLLEHRFFGESQPFNNTSVESYKYLTIDQALADLKTFILKANKIFFWKFTKPRWVLFGASYPGALAAWFRATNEDLTTAAIVSSGIVHPRVDNHDYLKNVQNVLEKMNPKCAEAIGLGMEEIISKTYTWDGRMVLATAFNTCEPFPEKLTPETLQYFFTIILYLFKGSVIYSGQNFISVRDLCEIMLSNKEKSYMKRIQNAWNYQNVISKWNRCNNIDYKINLAYLNDSSLDGKSNVEDRSFKWLSCTELGLLQTTNYGKSIFGSTIPLDYYSAQCMELFGDQYDARRIRDGVHRTLRKYGGNSNYNGSRTVFVNGSNDPWKSLCCLKCNNAIREVYSVTVEGSSHCNDMQPIKPSDSQSLKNARVFVGMKLEMFIRKSF